MEMTLLGLKVKWWHSMLLFTKLRIVFVKVSPFNQQTKVLMDMCKQNYV